MQAWIIVFGAWDPKFLPGKKSRKNRKNRVKLCKNHVKLSKNHVKLCKHRVNPVKVPGKKKCLGSRIPGSRILSRPACNPKSNGKCFISCAPDIYHHASTHPESQCIFLLNTRLKKNVLYWKNAKTDFEILDIFCPTNC